MPSEPGRPVVVDPLIRQYRTADATVAVTSGGEPLADRDVVLAQRGHKFRFGCNGFELVELANGELEGEAKARAEVIAAEWLGLFNFATLPFYWGRFEPQRGRPDTDRLLAAARWFVERGVGVKGHTLCWHTVCAGWLLGLSDDEIVEAQRARIEREVTGFRGVIDAWDVVNEAVIMPIFDREANGVTRICRANGRIPTIRMAFDAARASNPSAMLLLNDFDMSAAYECLIEGCLEAGIRIDALGLQSHMHQGYWGEEKTLAILDRFARYGLPIHFTENTILSGELMPPEIVDLNDYQPATWPTTPEGEARQADEVVRHYKTLLSHPSVEAISWWDLPDGRWLNAPAGLIRENFSPKPAYEALRSLVKGEWWLAPTTMRTDSNGELRFSGFLGEYEVAAAGSVATFRLDAPGAVSLEVRLDGAPGAAAATAG